MDADDDRTLARDALEAHPAPTLLLTAEGILLHANAAALEAFGGKGLPDDGAILRSCRSAVNEGRTVRSALAWDGKTWELALAPIGEGPARPVVATFAASRPEVDLEALAAGLAHEIRNPLAGLQGAAELLAAELEAGSPHRAYAEVIAREAHRVDGLVRALLDLTRPPALKTAPHNVHEVCEHVASLVGVGANVALDRRYDPSLPELEIDRDAIVQVLLNLLRNAIQAMAGREGTVAVETAVATGTRVRIGGRSRGLARISILDEGPGLPKDLELFTPFVTTRRGGTGLGLVIARRLVEAHGGRLELRDRRDGGAEALVLLPFA